MKVLVTGGFGLIGSRLLEIWGNKYDLVVLDQVDESSKYPHISFRKIDLTDKEAVAAALFEEKPDYVLHLAAYVDVEKAEVERDLCWEVNVNMTRNLAEAARDQKSRFIYISTGFVFDGKKDSYLEDDPESPVNYYGLTKAEGERTLKKTDLNLCILRINFPYRTKWEKKSDTIRWMVPKLQNGEEVTLVNDQFISPTFIDDLTQVIDQVITKNATGTYHVCASDCLSFFEIGKKVAAEFGVDEALVKETTLDDFLLKTGRKAGQPRRSCLLSKKVEEQLGVKLTTFSEGLKKVRESYEESY